MAASKQEGSAGTSKPAEKPDDKSVKTLGPEGSMYRGARAWRAGTRPM